MYLSKLKIDEIIRVILNKTLFYCTCMLNFYDPQSAETTNKGHRVAIKKSVLIVVVRFRLKHSFLYVRLIETISIGKTLGTCKGDYSST